MIIIAVLTHSFCLSSEIDVTHLLAKLIKGMSQHTRRLGTQESSNQLHWFICVFESCAVAKCVTELDAENEFKNHLKDRHNIYPSYFRDEEKEFDQLSIILVVKCPGKGILFQTQCQKMIFNETEDTNFLI